MDAKKTTADEAKEQAEAANKKAEADRVAAEQKAAQDANDAKASGQHSVTAGAAHVSRDPDAPTREERRRDAELERERGNRVRTNNPAAPEAVAKQHEDADRKREELNERNREGHAKNMERIENEAAEAQARTEHAHDHRANHTPTGKQDNRNTPIVNKDGSKVWL